MVDDFPVNTAIGSNRRSGITRNVVSISQLFHEGVKHLGRFGNCMHATGQRIAEAQPRKGRHNKVKGLIDVWVIGIGEDVGNVPKGQVGERERRYQEQRHRVGMARPRMDEVHPRRAFSGRCLDADSELGNRLIDFTLMFLPGKVLKPSDFPLTATSLT